jgi:hypothetical protein
MPHGEPWVNCVVGTVVGVGLRLWLWLRWWWWWRRTHRATVEAKHGVRRFKKTRHFLRWRGETGAATVVETREDSAATVVEMRG